MSLSGRPFDDYSTGTLRRSYTDASGRRRRVPARAFAELQSILHAARIRHDRHFEVIAVRPGRASLVTLTDPPAAIDTVEIRAEDGSSESRALVSLVSRSPHALDLQLLDLPVGYFDVTIRSRRAVREFFVISAPARLPRRYLGAGVLQPVYGVRADQDWGIGSYGALARLGSLLGEMGASFVGALPCLAIFLDEPIDPSPYRPISRFALNELYLDLAKVADLEMSPGAQSPLVAMREAAPTGATTVDYPAVANRARCVMETLAEEHFRRNGARSALRRAFLAEHPEIAEYAEFRARGDRLRSPGYDPRRYHEYAQFLCDEQLRELAGTVPLYLDYPVGVHPAGFDVIAHPRCFIAALSTGAPPDDFFDGGQDWAFPPPDVEGLRDDRYGYLIRALRSAFRYASVLRIDHVMGLQRLWVLPQGASPTEGAYLEYPDEELRAVVLVEAWRAGATVVGEDLGTVLHSTRRALVQDGFLHSAVYRFEATADEPLPAVAPGSFASFGTHDLERFASFVAEGEGDPSGTRRRWICNLEEQLDMPAGAPARQLYGALMTSIAVRHPDGLLLDLGDLIGDPTQENCPGVATETNWSHRMLQTVENLAHDDSVRVALESTSRAMAGEEGTLR